MSKSLIWRWVAIIVVILTWGISIPPVKDRDVMDMFVKLSARKVERLARQAESDSPEAVQAKEKLEAFGQLVERAKAIQAKDLEENQGQATVTPSQAILQAAIDDVNWRGARLRDYISVPVSRNPSNRAVMNYVRQRAAGKLSLGLDLRGGTEFVISFNPDDPRIGDRPVVLLRDQILEIMRNRIDVMGVLEPEIRTLTDNTISLRIPTVSSAQKAQYRRLIQDSANIKFYIVDPNNDTKVLEYESGAPNFAPSPGYQPRPFVMESERNGEIVTERVFLKQQPERIRGEDVEAAFANLDEFGRWQINLKFNGRGGRAFGEVTAANVKERLAIVMDGTVYSAPVIQSAITGGTAVITGNFSNEEARRLAGVISAGNLPVDIKIDSEFGTDPTLGEDSIKSGFWAALGGMLIVVLFMVFYYRLSGLVAVTALVCNIILVFGTMALFGATLTLPGIAGIVLTIGMAVDANVLIYERIREEMKNGKTVANAIKSGYARVFVTILDSNLTTLLTAFILYKAGTGQIRGFAVTLSVGIIASMFTALFMTRAIFDLFLEKGLTKLDMRSFPGITDCNYPILSYRKITAILSGILIVVCLIGSAYRLATNTAMGVDFMGGTEVVFRVAEDAEPPVADVRAFLDSQGVTGARVGYKASTLQEGRHLEITFKGEAGQHSEGKSGQVVVAGDLTIEQLGEKLNQQFPEAKFKEISTTTVGSLVGNQFRNRALLAAALAIAGIVVYISFRFELAYGVASVVALAHDVIIAMGIFLILPGRELSMPVVAALLTIIGYSLNDTIVVFDRIREDLSLRRDGTYTDIVNLSINQTLGRTVLTSLTTAFVVFTLLLFGGGAINDFALVMFIGVIVGTYSSVFVATTIISYWHKSSRQHLEAEAKAARAAAAEA